MSRQRAKGTRWETELLTALRAVWPHAERAPLRGIQDRGDFNACNQWLLEAKNTTTPRFLEWARTARRKAGPDPWAVLWHGDRRADDGQPLALIDLTTFLHLATLEMITPARATDSTTSVGSAARGSGLRPTTRSVTDANAGPSVETHHIEHEHIAALTHLIGELRGHIEHLEHQNRAHLDEIQLLHLETSP